MFLTEHIIKQMSNNLTDIEQDENQLYEYIIDLAKYGDENEQSKVLKIEKYINHTSSEVKSAVFFALLFVLKIDNEEYKSLAIKYLSDKNEDEDLRVKCSSGLAQTYSDSKDKTLLSILSKILYDKSDSMYVISSVFNSLLLIYGLSSREIFLRREGYKQYADEEDLIEFHKEFKEIKEIVS